MAGGNNAIGSGAIVLTTNADGLASGFSQAKADLNHFGQTASSSISKGIAGASSSGGGILSGLMSAAAAHPFVAVGVAAGTALVAGFHLATERLGELGKIKKQADVLGVSPSELQGFEMLLKKAGLDAEAVSGVFAKMGKNLVAGLEGGEKAAAFLRLGLDPQKLKGQQYTEQFKQIANAIQKLPPGAEQAAAAMNIFGKSGFELLPMLQRGGKGIDEFIEHAKKTGAILSDEQFATAGKAAKAWKEAKESISQAWEGLTNRMAVAAAPLVKFWGGVVVKAMELISPLLERLGRMWERMGLLAELAFEMIGEGIQVAMEWLNGLLGEVGVFEGKWPTIEEVVTGAFRMIGMIGSYAWDAIKKGMGYVAIGISELINGLLTFKDTLRDILATYAKLPLLITGPMGLAARYALKEFDAIASRSKEIGDRIGQWGDKAANSVYGSTFAEFEKRLAKALAPKPKAIEVPKLMQKDAEVWNPAKLAGAIDRGSKEAYSIEMRSRYGEYGKPENNVHQENGRKIDGVKTAIMGLDGRLAGLTDKLASMEVI